MRIPVPALLDGVQEADGNLLQLPEIRVWCHPHRVGRDGPHYFRRFHSFAGAVRECALNPSAEETPLLAFRGFELNLFGIRPAAVGEDGILGIPSSKRLRTGEMLTPGARLRGFIEDGGNSGPVAERAGDPGLILGDLGVALRFLADVRDELRDAVRGQQGRSLEWCKEWLSKAEEALRINQGEVVEAEHV